MSGETITLLLLLGVLVYIILRNPNRRGKWDGDD